MTISRSQISLIVYCFSSCDFVVSQVEVEKRHEEQRKFGVFFDDDYDYLQHLKESSGLCELVASGPSHSDHQIGCLRDEDEEEEDAEEVIPVSVLSLSSAC